MKYFRIPLYLCLSVLLFSACKKDQTSGKWLISKDDIFDEGPGKDGIPSIDNINFVNAALTLMEITGAIISACYFR